MKLEAFTEAVDATLDEDEVVCQLGRLYGFGQALLAAVVAREEDDELVEHRLLVADLDPDNDTVHPVDLRFDQVAPSGRGLHYATNVNDSGLIDPHRSVFVSWESGNVMVNGSPINPL